VCGHTLDPSPGFRATVSVAMVRRRRQGEPVGGEFTELAALADGSLATQRRAALEARVAASSELADRLAEQERAIALARSAAAEVEAPAALRARVEAQRRARRVPVSRRFVLAGAAAAALLILAIGPAVFRSSPSSERFQAALGPTGLSPGASGEATLTKTSSGWRIELDATGLPRLDGRRFYEAWLRNPTGVLVPIGTFNAGRKVTLWAGVSPKVLTTLTVTRERSDGNQASSGEKVLVGTVKTGG
jgi:anti-sigma-K factor RskA